MLLIDRLQQASSSVAALNGPNLQITVFFRDEILDLESDFRKLGFVAMLRSLLRILLASLAQIDTEMAKKYAKQR